MKRLPAKLRPARVTARAVRAFQRRMGKRVRELRLERVVSVVELARAAGLAQPHMTRLETGESAFKSRTILKVARALGVRPRELMSE